MRRDLPELVALAKRLGLKVDLQTNAVLLTHDLFERLAPNLDRLGFSLDGATAGCHDRIRSAPGNFDMVISGIRLAERLRIPVVVRTMVCSTNVDRLKGMPVLLKRFINIKKWSLREFAPLGRGMRTKEQHRIPRELFMSRSLQLQRESARAKCDFRVCLVSESDMARCYCLVSPDGRVYTHPTAGDYASVGKFPNTDLSELLSRLPYDAEKRRRRDSVVSS
jgi:MoaA/NifB/PqqE/SkfB family radical SAM enzyme